MANTVYEKYDGSQVTESMLQEAAELFSHNYGFWGKQAPTSAGTSANLLIHRDYRERGLATGLLVELKEQDDEILGVMTSHPATCLAAARAFGCTIEAVQLDFIKEHAEGIIKLSPITYIRTARPYGSLFASEDCDGAVSSADTSFFVDHREPCAALERVRQNRDWPLGELLEGKEFLLILEAKKGPRSSTSARV
ncbi:hypothetical protein PRK78_006102 [Emydomyces testavorans]|uniref:N-acetyltransferase domain-containing protein n=1 Tax=Emydomyces testavorans TaxID=2070801 RepID=A0AAF0DKT2_9EURO|nr:hypothetical protein PRK78_006102 [Emydomyces testavorans]